MREVCEIIRRHDPSLATPRQPAHRDAGAAQDPVLRFAPLVCRLDSGVALESESWSRCPYPFDGGTMRATVMHSAGDVRIEDVPDANLVDPTDALIRITRACICGSDLWPYKNMEPTDGGRPMGHEAIGVVEEVGPEVRTVKAGDVVVMPFAFSDGTCLFCEDGLQTECVHGGFFGSSETGGAQAEALRIPQADGTLYALPAEADEASMPGLLTLSDVLGTGHHAAVVAGVEPGKTVAVVGDGAVGLCGVIAAKRLGAEQIVILGHHQDRTDLAREFGATDVVSERGEEAVEKVRELTGGFGAHSVLEC